MKTKDKKILKGGSCFSTWNHCIMSCEAHSSEVYSDTGFRVKIKANDKNAKNNSSEDL